MKRGNQNRHNHAAKMELRARINREAGLVAERFPGVSGIVIHMTYFRKAAVPLLMVRTLNIYPTSYANFRMDCMTRGCAGGGYDLTASISSMVKNRATVGKGALVCHGKVDKAASRHAHIEYKTVIQYKKPAKAAS